MNSDGQLNREKHPPESQIPSPGERAIERAKRTQLRPGQFRLATLLTAISLLAVALGVVRLSGVDYEWFFSFCSVGVCIFLPFVSWFLVALLGMRSRRRRYLTSGGLSVLGVIALSLAAAVHPPLRDPLFVTLFAVVVFWPLLAICAHSFDVEAFGRTKERDPNSLWNRFTLGLARLQEHGGETTFRCCRCQRIRMDSRRFWRPDGWLCHECYLFEIRHAEELQIPKDDIPLPDEDD